MAIRFLLITQFIFMILFSSIQSLPLSDDSLTENDSTFAPYVIIHPFNFISLICQQQEQYRLKLRRKFCSNDLQLYKIQEQQRVKRVGWTISV
jgi:hypothetical protein